MKCISIWQPYASLLFCPAEVRKHYETRPNRLGLVWVPHIQPVLAKLD